VTEARRTRMQFGLACTAVFAAILVTAGSVFAGNITGTPGNDVLRGTARGDKLDGKSGNDRLYGRGGRDVLVGGAGNDTLVGGAGRDVLDCGPGRDVAVADASDAISASCESLEGIPRPALSIGDASVREGNSGATALSFAVSLSTATPVPVSVRFGTSDGTATAPSDYAATKGVLTFRPGQTRVSFRVEIAGDTTFEQDETFGVTLSSPRNASIADGSATATIADDDPTPARPGIYSGRKSSPLYDDYQSAGFWVLEDGQSVSRFDFTFVADCEPEGTFGVRVTAPGPVGLSPDKKFSVTALGEGTTNLEVTGAFDAAGTSASGTFRAHAGFTSEGTHYDCDSGQRTWTAARILGLPPDITESIDDAGTLTVAFDDSGQKQYASVSYKLDATVHARWACSGGTTIDAFANSTTSITGLVPNGKGHVLGTLKLGAPPPQASCPGAALKLVEYSQVIWTNVTSGDRFAINGPSRTYP
jgi:Calx-beta domain-containing protein/hemolysin type calcium-binding protein